MPLYEKEEQTSASVFHNCLSCKEASIILRHPSSLHERKIGTYERGLRAFFIRKSSLNTG